MPGNPTAQFNGTVEGVWLLPMTASNALVTSAQAWIGASSPDLNPELEMEVFAPPSRQAKVSQVGALHFAEGTIDGLLLNRNGQTADTWATRLDSLVENQHLYRVFLSSARYYFQVELGSPSRQPRIAGGPAWSVQVPYRRLA